MSNLSPNPYPQVRDATPDTNLDVGMIQHARRIVRKELGDAQDSETVRKVQRLNAAAAILSHEAETEGPMASMIAQMRENYNQRRDVPDIRSYVPKTLPEIGLQKSLGRWDTIGFLRSAIEGGDTLEGFFCQFLLLSKTSIFIHPVSLSLIAERAETAYKAFEEAIAERLGPDTPGPQDNVEKRPRMLSTKDVAELCGLSDEKRVELLGDGGTIPTETMRVLVAEGKLEPQWEKCPPALLRLNALDRCALMRGPKDFAYEAATDHRDRLKSGTAERLLAHMGLAEPVRQR